MPAGASKRTPRQGGSGRKCEKLHFRSRRAHPSKNSRAPCLRRINASPQSVELVPLVNAGDRWQARQLSAWQADDRGAEARKCHRLYMF